MNRKGFANIVLIILVVVLAGAFGYVILIKKPASVEQPQSNNLQNTQTATPSPSGNTVSKNPSAIITQLTKEQVLNGYDRCGNQFKNGVFEFPGGYEAWSKWDLSRYKEGKISCPPYAALDQHEPSIGGQLVFADLDGDGVNEALASARVVAASSAGALYVFKNFDGTARVIDSVIIGKENIRNVSINKDVVVGKTDGYTPTTKTYKFVNGKLIAQ